MSPVTPALSSPYYQQDFLPEELSARRGRVAAAIGAGAAAVLRGGRESGTFEVFRQTNEFYYLTGVEVPHAYLLLRGSGGSTLYLPDRNPRHESSEGRILSAGIPDEVRALTGIEAVRPLGALAADLAELSRVYVCHSPAEGRQACRDVLLHQRRAASADPWAAGPDDETRFLDQVRLWAPDAELQNLNEVLDPLRLHKRPAELAQMRRAGELTGVAVREAMRATRPGLYEYQLAAVADYVFGVNGARGCGYCPIIAAGANIWNAHYNRLGSVLRDGELVLMDYAPDLGYYTSDIGRMWPVNGRYSAVQRELYGFMVAYHQELLRRLRPGVTPETVLAEAAAAMAPVVEATAWSKPAYREAALRTLTFPGHLSHPVGMAVHDVGRYFGRPMEPGLVFALDPQLWVPEEQLYVRVEDTVAITDTGVEVLTAAAPLELDEVEAMVGGRGLLQDYPPLIRAN